MNRALRVEDLVEVRPSQLQRVRWCCGDLDLQADARYRISGEHPLNGRRCLHLKPDSVFEIDWPLHLWPSMVRLADGTAARADRRFAKREKEIETMKAARRNEKKAKRKP